MRSFLAIPLLSVLAACDIPRCRDDSNCLDDAPTCVPDGTCRRCMVEVLTTSLQEGPNSGSIELAATPLDTDLLYVKSSSVSGTFFLRRLDDGIECAREDGWLLSAPTLIILCGTATAPGSKRVFEAADSDAQCDVLRGREP